MKRVSRIVRLGFCALMVLSLTAQALIPAGFMPGQGRDGRIEIVICSSSGPSSIFVEAKDSPYPLQEHPERKASHNEICPYAPVLTQSVLPPVVDVTPPIIAQGPGLLPFTAVAAIYPVAKAYQAQAPPFFS